MKRRQPASGRVRGGLTLIETCLAIVIIGVGITASVQLMSTATSQNANVAQTTVGVFLAENIREMLASVKYCNTDNPDTWGERVVSASALAAGAVDLDDFDGAIIGCDASPSGSPVDALFQPVSTYTTTSGAQPFTSLSRYTQKITVKKLSSSNLKALDVTAQDAGIRRVDVDVLFRPAGATKSQSIYSMTFFRFRDRK